MRLNLFGAANLAELLVCQIQIACRPPKKVIALDFDNTLWGGVIGEAGINGIQLGDEDMGLCLSNPLVVCFGPEPDQLNIFITYTRDV
jgi:predicted enzyme involved in methoxymalonyl-ACP biosynthesis